MDLDNLSQVYMKMISIERSESVSSIGHYPKKYFAYFDQFDSQGKKKVGKNSIFCMPRFFFGFGARSGSLPPPLKKGYFFLKKGFTDDFWVRRPERHTGPPPFSSLDHLIFFLRLGMYKKYCPAGLD